MKAACCIIMLLLGRLHRAAAFAPKHAWATSRRPYTRSTQGSVRGASLMTNAPPLKVQVFVDGTWLYYSFFARTTRNCEIRSKLGAYWYRDYKVLWERIPVIVGRAIQEQLQAQQQTDRFVEVYRTTVFSSLRQDTDPESLRMRMFTQMQRLNFDVHLSVTTGLQEKCIDIALAVDMLHYATVPGAYDMAVLLSGDKDFMPAMLRTREKGKRVGLCSMRNSCNRALLDPAAHTMDFGVIWLDDYFDELFEKQRGRMENSPMPADMLCEMVAGILEKHGSAMSSRLLGRELQAIKVGNVNILNLVKEHFGHLRAFLESYNDSFICSLPNASGLTASQKAEYMVMLREEEEHEIREAKLGGAAEDSNSATAAVAADVDDYDSTDEEASLASEEQHEQRQQLLQSPPLPDNLESLKVQELKDLLKERGLPVVGRKSELVERLQEFLASLPLPLSQQDDVSSDDDDEDQLAESSTRAGDADEAWNDEKEVHRYTPYTYEEALAARGNSRKPAGKSRRLEEALKRAKESMQSARVESKIDFAAADALLRDAITSFLSNQPAHEATGRNVGRHLTAMRWPEDMGRSIDTPTALAYLKHRHGSLSQFLLEHNKDVETYTSTTGSIPELMVKLIE